jgi:glycosyltransferase involved in cell wall biosynthesis
VANWNAGLAAAKGRYCVVVHHDEFFADVEYLRNAVSALDAGGYPAIVGRCAVIGVVRRSRFDRVQRVFRVMRAPLWTIFVANWIGSTACVVFRRDPVNVFDESLINTVDVEFYCRLFRRRSALVWLPKLCVASLGHHSAQISSSIEGAKVSYNEIRALTALGNQPLSAMQRRLLLCVAWVRKAFGTRK